MLTAFPVFEIMLLSRVGEPIVQINRRVLRLCLPADDIKPCPRCAAYIIKMNDGSCNHMTCAVCGCEFCWLCMKEISDLHYLRSVGGTRRSRVQQCCEIKLPIVTQANVIVLHPCIWLKTWKPLIHIVRVRLHFLKTSAIPTTFRACVSAEVSSVTFTMQCPLLGVHSSVSHEDSQ